MKTWTRSLLRPGGGLETTQVTHYSPETSVSRGWGGGGVAKQGSAGEEDTLGKAQVFFQWKMVVARRAAARETLRDEFIDLKTAIGRLVAENQILRLRGQKQRVFRAWKYAATRRQRRTVPPVVLRKFIRNWVEFASKQQEKRETLTSLRKKRSLKLKKGVFFAFRTYQVRLRRCLRTLNKRCCASLVSDSFLAFQQRLRWRAKVLSAAQRSEATRGREALQSVFAHWRGHCWAVSRSLKLSVSQLHHKRRALLRLSLGVWLKSVVKREKLRQLAVSVVRKTQKSGLFRLKVQSMRATAALLEQQIEELPLEMEANFASELESRIQAMKTDFETERKDYLAQRNALIERHMALKKAYGQHAGRIYESLSNDRSVLPE